MPVGNTPMCEYAHERNDCVRGTFCTHPDKFYGACSITNCPLDNDSSKQKKIEVKE